MSATCAMTVTQVEDRFMTPLPLPVQLGASTAATCEPSEGAASSSTAELSATPRLALAQQDDEDHRMPRMFEWFLLAVAFSFMSNYTVLLPTAHAYAASLGGSGWFAGLVIASSMIPSMLTTPFMAYFVRPGYKPILFLQLTLSALSNATYGLGQLVASRWLLVGGQVLRSLFWGAGGPALAQHAIYACTGKRGRSESLAILGNMQFLGMGMGPVFAAALSRVSFSVGLLEVDEFTNPGWFYAIVWLAMLAWLTTIPEPPRPFLNEAPKPAAAHATHGDADAAEKGASAKVYWCLLTVLISSGTVAVWETSAAIVTQSYFKWGVATSSLFIGAIFICSMVGGEAIRTVIRGGRFTGLREADISVGGIVGMAVSSAALYWYLPVDAPAGAVVGNQIAYVIGSILVVIGANLARTYAISIGIRTAAGVSSQMKDRACKSVAQWMTVGRGGGAFCGMGLAVLPNGADGAAGLVTVSALILLGILLAPDLHRGLRDQ